MRVSEGEAEGKGFCSVAGSQFDHGLHGAASGSGERRRRRWIRWGEGGGVGGGGDGGRRGLRRTEKYVVSGRKSPAKQREDDAKERTQTHSNPRKYENGIMLSGVERPRVPPRDSSLYSFIISNYVSTWCPIFYPFSSF